MRILTTLAEAATENSHLWEIALTLVSLALVGATLWAAYATQKLVNVTLRMTNIEMRKVADTAIRAVADDKKDEREHSKA